MTKKILSIIFSICLLVTVFAGCNKKNAEVPKNKDSVIIAMGTASEPESGFDPAHGWGAGEHVHEPLIQSTLTVTTNDLEIEYDLATDMITSPDGLTWTVKIRDDVKFTDGKKLTAKDVAFTYNTLKKTSSVNDFTMLDKAEATDATTVVFHLNKAYSIWPYTMAIVGIVPEHAYGKDYGSHPIGSGRYKLKQWDKGQQVIFEANENYYGKKVKMKKVTILFMSEDAAFSAVKAGQVDLAYTAASYSKQKIKNYELLSFKSVDNRTFNLPTIAQTKNNDGLKIGNNVTNDIAIRKAVNIGLDRNEMIKNVLNGHGTPAFSVCDNMPWDSSLNEVKYDLKGAIKILDDAGWVKGSDGIRAKNGVRAEISIMYPSGDSVRQALSADTKNQLKKIGISVVLQGVSWDEAYDRAKSEIMTWGWGSHTPMEIYNIYHSNAKTGLADYSPYSNATADKLMDKALASSSLEESYKLWQEAQVEINKDVPWIWLVNIDHLYWSNKKLNVAEQKLHPHGHGWSIVNNVDQWTWDN
ncbi:MAG: ABC transporter substrate-binding protein [Oscillospiraceae bacterium]